MESSSRVLRLENASSGSMFSQIGGEVRMAVRARQGSKYSVIQRTIDAALADFDIDQQEADYLRAFLAILLIDPVTRRGEWLQGMRTYDRDALKRSPYDLKEADMHEQYRDDNNTKFVCSHLSLNVQTMCAECLKDPRGWCTEKCPVREAEMEKEPELLVA